MLKLYTTPGCTSCRKAKQWLTKNKIPFIEQNFMKHPFTRKEIIQILQQSTGIDDIISFRSQAYQQLTIDINDLSLNEFITLLLEQPSMIKRPLLTDGTRLQIGFNSDDIHVWISREKRKKQRKQLFYKMAPNILDMIHNGTHR